MNVFLVEAPHHLINGLEAKQAFDLEDNEVVVIPSGAHPIEDFRFLVADGEWEAVHYLDERPPVRSAFHRYLRDHRSVRVRNYCRTVEELWLRRELDAMAAALGRAETLLVGCYFNERVRHFANVLPHERLVLLDDGTTTLQIAEGRLRHAAGQKVPSRGGLKESLVSRLMGWDPTPRDRVTFFTTYDLDVPATDTVVRHSYKYLRDSSARRERSDDVLFLGMSLYWEGIDEEIYFQQLRQVGEYYAGSRIVYAPHRGEQPERVERVRKELGWTVRRHPTPVEYQLAMCGPMPRVLASFFSSALENCRIIFGPELMVEAIYFEPALLPAQSQFVQTVYDYFETKTGDHFRLVRL